MILFPQIGCAGAHHQLGLEDVVIISPIFLLVEKERELVIRIVHHAFRCTGWI